MSPKTTQDAIQKRYQFWETQPVPRFDDNFDTSEPIKKTVELREEPYNLPEGFAWDTLDIGNDDILKELYTLLNENYVEDDDCMFRFDYSPQFLRWALQPPGWQQDWHCGVRVSKSKKLVGFIGATPARMHIATKEDIQMVEINFLCVHKKLRSKRMAPVLIREITRRVNLQGIFQAIYTAGVILPKPIGTCRYYHRSLNPKKLVDVKFSSITRNMNMKRTLRLYKLPESPKLEGLQQMNLSHVPQVHEMLLEYLKKFDLAPTFSLEEVEHWFLPKNDVINSYVVEVSMHGRSSGDFEETEDSETLMLNNFCFILFYTARGTRVSLHQFLLFAVDSHKSPHIQKYSGGLLLLQLHNQAYYVG